MTFVVAPTLTGYPAPPALLAKLTTLLAAVEPMTTTSAVGDTPIWMVAPAVYEDGGAAARVQLVFPIAIVPETVAGFAKPEPTVDRSPKTLSKK